MVTKSRIIHFYKYNRPTGNTSVVRIVVRRKRDRRAARPDDVKKNTEPNRGEQSPLAKHAQPSAHRGADPDN